MKEQVIDIKYDLLKWLGSKIRKREGIVLGMDLLVRLTAGVLTFWVSFTLISGVVVNAGSRI